MADENAEATGNTLVSKITPKLVGKPHRAKDQADGRAVYMGRIMGLVTGTQKKVQPNGDVFIALVGNFEAINGETGEIFESGICYLPGGMHEQVVAVMEKGATTAEFALDLATVKADNPAGYSWQGKVLLAQASTPLDAMKAKLPKTPRQLALEHQQSAAVIEGNAKAEATGKQARK